MTGRQLDLAFDIQGPLEDGTLLATCRQLPMIVAATTERELRERVVLAIERLSAMLERLGPAAAEQYLKEAGVELRSPQPETADARTMTFPVLVRAG